jgi:serine/threonine-protein kinase
LNEAQSREPAYDVGHVVAERYEILEVLGHGMTGTVYRARDLHVDSAHEIVALKAIHAHLHTDRQIFGRFRREVKILEKLEGAHLCKLLECIEEDGSLMIALEYVEGPSLEEYLRERDPLPLAEVVTIAGQICEALAIAHKAGVVHRDLKPSNVLIEGSSTPLSDGPPASFLSGLSVRVVDFGLAKLVHGDVAAATVLTEQDMIFGTPDYMAPEQVMGEELDGRCDIYAVGVILFEMLCGRLPFDTPGPLTTMSAHINTPVPSLTQSAPERSIPRSVERVVTKALQKKPADRFASARELARALESARDAPEPEDAAIADTALTVAQDGVSTTLNSPRNSSIEAMKGRGAKVQVVVRDAPVSSEKVSERRPEPSSRQRDDDERRIWTWVAVVAAIAAVALGIFMGTR